MKYGLIGEKLSHSFSKEIHSRLCQYDYELLEIEESRLQSFFEKKSFIGINVTIPYKTSVIKYLDFIDDAAKEIGAVNTVVNKGGKLYGYNTDAFGLKALIQRNGIEIKGKKVLILGGGGTSKTALFVAKNMGAKAIVRVSRTNRPDFVTYSDANLMHTDSEVLINTTPVGMFPNVKETPIDTRVFKNLKAVVDVIYNPINSRLVLSAREKGIKAVGGLYMLVSQAYRSAELFSTESIDCKKIDEIYNELLKEKQNIVLIGMPSAGKTTIGSMLSKTLNMPFFDSDDVVNLKTGKTPAEIIKTQGEAAFRQIESEVIYELSLKNHTIIATGGGVPTVADNVTALKQNGRIYYIDRPIDLLEATQDRPLSSCKDDLISLYHKREKLYINAADKRIVNDKDLCCAAEEIRKDFCYENTCN